MTTGLDGMIACHSHLECGQTKVTKSKESKCVLTLVKGLSKSIQSRTDSYSKSLGLSRLLKVFESYTDTSSNELGTVTNDLQVGTYCGTQYSAIEHL